MRENRFGMSGGTGLFSTKVKLCYVRLNTFAGDEFHCDPHVTAILGIHSLHWAGNSICGNKGYGAYCIRLGPDDEIVNETHVVFYGQTSANRKPHQVTGQTARLVESFEQFPNQFIRVLLAGKKKYAGRKHPGSQYYLGHFYVHSYVYAAQKQQWEFTLRTSCKPLENKNHETCECCHSMQIPSASNELEN
jgi:hypothetical protein